MDAGQERLEKEFENLSKQLRKEYSQASKEVEAKLNTYLKKFEKKDEIKRAAVRSGALSKSEYEQWRVGQVAIGERWKEMRDVLATDLTNTDKIARSMINGKMPDAYAIGHNYATFTVEKGSLVDTSYTLYNRNAVNRILQDSPKLLPKSRVDIPKDLKWNQRKIQSAVTQGLLQGDRIPNIAKRLRGVTTMDYKASLRNARTSMTSAHNKGRLDSLFRAQSMGIEVAKEWVAYVDNVTRDSHIDVNGEVVPLEKTFSNGLDAPGGMGPPEEVYNCRCTMVAAFPKTGKSGTDAEKVNESYDEWEDRLTLADTVVNGKDISSTWERRQELYKFEIEDVINAQGFDGLPKVVSAEEFEAAVSRSGITAARGYTAPNKETLQKYHDELVSGKWYVDCSQGGALNGQGMYTVATRGESLSENMQRVVSMYGNSAEKVGRVERITFADDFKTLNADDVFAERKKLIYEQVKPDVTEKLGVLTEGEEAQLKMRLGISTSADEMNKAFSVAKDRTDLMGNVVDGLSDKVADLNLKYSRMDNGSFAALRGYDAIEVNAGGNDRHFVVLNRTKCIILGD